MCSCVCISKTLCDLVISEKSFVKITNHQERFRDILAEDAKFNLDKTLDANKTLLRCKINYTILLKSAGILYGRVSSLPMKLQSYLYILRADFDCTQKRRRRGEIRGLSDLITV